MACTGPPRRGCRAVASCSTGGAKKGVAVCRRMEGVVKRFCSIPCLPSYCCPCAFGVRVNGENQRPVRELGRKLRYGASGTRRVNRDQEGSGHRRRGRLHPRSGRDAGLGGR
ncbi:hypothetical protein ACFYXM_28515 [Streptomyces sp. NPDC002476]|uniref:hypothetical protein n=1 Tax=Streptomyces sp. NPDC002476 TaxID=3364648 RepID=UPI0036B234D1